MNWFKRSQQEYDAQPEWSFEEADHDYDPSWDYEIDVMPDQKLISITDQVMSEINTQLLPKIGMGKAKAAYIKNEANTVAVYAHGTAPYPVFMVNLKEIQDTCQEMVNEYGGDIEQELYIGIRSSLIHELGHAIQDWMGLEYDEDEAEDFARHYCDFGEIWSFWE